MAAQTKPVGYLPQDRPPFAAMVALGFQHVITMFPATVLVAILTGFDVGVTLFASGLATVVALLGSGMRIPLYYGSSFSYIAAVVGVVGAAWAVYAWPRAASWSPRSSLSWQACSFAGRARLRWTRCCRPSSRLCGHRDRHLFGQSRARHGRGQLGGGGVHPAHDHLVLGLSAGKGFVSMIPVLLALCVAMCWQGHRGRAVYASLGPARSMMSFGDGLSTVTRQIFAPVVRPAGCACQLSRCPSSNGRPSGHRAIAIATIPESTAHLYQISLYVDQLADDLGRKPWSSRPDWPEPDPGWHRRLYHGCWAAARAPTMAKTTR